MPVLEKVKPSTSILSLKLTNEADKEVAKEQKDLAKVRKARKKRKSWTKKTLSGAMMLAWRALHKKFPGLDLQTQDSFANARPSLREADQAAPIIGCALGETALFMEYGKQRTFHETTDHDEESVLGLFPDAARLRGIECLECGEVFYRASGLVPHLNDEHDWRMDKIARFLRKNGL